MRQQFGKAVREVESALGDIEPEAFDTACAVISGARRIGLYGCGREGLQMRGFAMRLYHLGCEAAYLGEMNTPPLEAGDLLIVSAGPGELATVNAMMRTAHAAGATVLFITALPDTRSASLADHVVAIPAQTMANDTDADTVLPMGSAYEGALFFVFEIMVDRLKTLLQVSAEEMRARHTNME